MSGWVKMHRKLQSNPIWLSEPFTRGQAWVDLILLANHSKGFLRARGVRVDVERGQVGMSHVKLSERWTWSRGKVKRFLNELEMDQQIVQQNNNITCLISIVNYNEYQGGDTANDTPSDTTDGQQTVQQTGSKQYTNKKEKNLKKEKNVKKFTPPELFEVKAYFCEKGYTEESSVKAFNYYDVADWVDSKGNKIKNWKQKMQGVWFKDENKIKTVKGAFDGGF